MEIDRSARSGKNDLLINGVVRAEPVRRRYVGLGAIEIARASENHRSKSYDVDFIGCQLQSCFGLSASFGHKTEIDLELGVVLHDVRRKFGETVFPGYFFCLAKIGASDFHLSARGMRPRD